MVERLFLCGLSASQSSGYTDGESLSLQGPNPSVVLKVKDLRERLTQVEPTLLTDLMEIAAYVFAADCLVSRGGVKLRNMGEDWRRRFRLVIGVRELAQWTNPELRYALQNALHFLSEDDWTFEFVQLHEPALIQYYLEFGDRTAERLGGKSIVLFSGGIDSFAGAVHELKNSNRDVVLLSRRIPGMIESRQVELARALKAKYGDRVKHAPMRVGLTKETRAVEETQRTRSFLLAALGLTAAYMEQSDSVRFYENGIMSVNLPIAAQIVGARASRSTHPRALTLLQKLADYVLDTRIAIENPFVWLTKVAVVQELQKTQFATLTRRTISCSGTRSIAKHREHCGVCAQCLHRQIAEHGADALDAVPDEPYSVDFFLGARANNDDRAMAVDTLRSALEFSRMSDMDFATRFAGEIGWVRSGFPDLPAGEVAKKVIELFRQHGVAVDRIVTKAIESHAAGISHGQLSPDCLLQLVPLGMGIRAPVAVFSEASIVPIQNRLQIPTDEALSDGLLLALDEQNHRIVIYGLAPIEGATNYGLMRNLIRRFKEDKSRDVAAGGFTIVAPDVLAKELKVDEAVVRNAIKRIRKQIREEYFKLHDEALALNDVIENIHGKGYRLNPRKVQLVALSEILRG
jgi:7-cyano-7-deazaguanine synthase in queuosine biosynthesis